MLKPKMYVNGKTVSWFNKSLVKLRIKKTEFN